MGLISSSMPSVGLLRVNDILLSKHLKNNFKKSNKIATCNIKCKSFWPVPIPPKSPINCYNSVVRIFLSLFPIHILTHKYKDTHTHRENIFNIIMLYIIFCNLPFHFKVLNFIHQYIQYSLFNDYVEFYCVDKTQFI